MLRMRARRKWSIASAARHARGRRGHRRGRFDAVIRDGAGRSSARRKVRALEKHVEDRRARFLRTMRPASQ